MGHGDDILIHVLKKLWRQEHGRQVLNVVE